MNKLISIYVPFLLLACIQTHHALSASLVTSIAKEAKKSVEKAARRECNLDRFRRMEAELEARRTEIYDLNKSIDTSTQALMGHALTDKHSSNEPDAVMDRGSKMIDTDIDRLNELGRLQKNQEEDVSKRLVVQRRKVKTYTGWLIVGGVAALVAGFLLCKSHTPPPSSSSSGSSSSPKGPALVVGGITLIAGGIIYTTPRSSYYRDLAQSCSPHNNTPRISGVISGQLILARSNAKMLATQDKMSEQSEKQFQELRKQIEDLRASMAEGNKATAEQFKEIMALIRDLTQARKNLEEQLAAIRATSEKTAEGVHALTTDMAAIRTDVTQMRAEGPRTQEELKSIRASCASSATADQVNGLERMVTSVHSIVSRTDTDLADLRLTGKENKEQIAGLTESQKVIKEIALRTEQALAHLIALCSKTKDT